jgi:hypothetical protein
MIEFWKYLTQDSSALSASVNNIPMYPSSCKSSVIYKLALCNSMTVLLRHIHFQKATLFCCVPDCSYLCSYFIKLFYYALCMLMFKDSCRLGCNPVSLGVRFPVSWRNCPSAPYKLVEQRLKMKILITLEFTTIVTRHGKTKSYLHRFKLADNPTCPCNEGAQSPEYIMYECRILKQPRSSLKQHITASWGHWPPDNSELVDKYLNAFSWFIKSIDFNKLQ